MPHEELHLFSDDRLVLMSASVSGTRDIVRRMSASVSDARDIVRRTQELIEQSRIMLHELDHGALIGRRLKT